MKSGFTAIELMITLSIIAILAIVGIPVFTHILEANKLKTTANYCSQQLRYARSEAIKHHANITVVFETGSSWCYGITSGSSCNCNTSGSCELGSTNYQTVSHISLTTENFSDNFTLNGTRGLASTNGAIIFSTNNKTIKVEFNKIGNIHLCSDNIGGYSPC